VLRLRCGEAAGGFLISSGAFAFSCEAPGPPCRIVEGDLVDVDISILLAILLIALVRGILLGVGSLALLVGVLRPLCMRSRVGFGISAGAFRAAIVGRNWRKLIHDDDLSS
jgi:hypothetical protein